MKLRVFLIASTVLCFACAGLADVASEEFDDARSSIFIAPYGNDEAKGTIMAPLASLGEAARRAKPGDTIFVRGGLYTNKGYLDGDLLKKGGTQDIICSGTEEHPIAIRPYGDERPLYRFDGPLAIRISGDHIIFEGFEVEGVAQFIDPEEALESWWDADAPSFYNGNGIVVNGNHVTVQDCVIHDVPAKALGSSGGDHILFQRNIVYNSSWWTTKGANSFSLMDVNDSVVDAETRMTARQNLIFACEQRIFSRIWGKGFATLTIDESPGLHVQINDGDYSGRILLEENVCLYNGKGGLGVNHSDRVDLVRNTFYLNGSTVSSGRSGIYAQSAEYCSFIGNAIEVREGHSAFDIQPEGNVFSGNYIVEISALSRLPKTGAMRVSRLFRDPERFDFRLVEGLPAEVGASSETLEFFRRRIAEYGVKVLPSGYSVDEAGMTRHLLEHAPEGASIDYSAWPREVRVTFPSGSIHPAGPEIKLKLRIDPKK